MRSSMNNYLPRDSESLLKKYKPLIDSTYARYKYLFTNTIGSESYMQGAEGSQNREIPNKYAQEDLYSYISEQFIKLIKEYDPNGGVDLPGYLASKLPRRVLGSYIHGRSRDRQRESVSYESNGIETAMATTPSVDNSSVVQIVQLVEGDLETPMDKYIFNLLTSKNEDLTKTEMYHRVLSAFPGIKKSDYTERLDYIKGRVSEEIYDNHLRLFGSYSNNAYANSTGTLKKTATVTRKNGDIDYLPTASVTSISKVYLNDRTFIENTDYSYESKGIIKWISSNCPKVGDKYTVDYMYRYK